MAKKSQPGRSRPLPPQAKGQTRKPQAPERAGTATLVRQPSSATPETPSAANIVAEPQTTEPKPQPTSTASTARPASGEGPAAARAIAPKAAASKPAATPKPAAAKPAAAPVGTAARPGAGATREQNQRLARARAVQRARQANLISAESYSYVLGDLKLVVALAVSAFAILIALTFVLPH